MSCMLCRRKKNATGQSAAPALDWQAKSGKTAIPAASFPSRPRRRPRRHPSRTFARLSPRTATSPSAAVELSTERPPRPSARTDPRRERPPRPSRGLLRAAAAPTPRPPCSPRGSSVDLQTTAPLPSAPSTPASLSAATCPRPSSRRQPPPPVCGGKYPPSPAHACPRQRRSRGRSTGTSPGVVRSSCPAPHGSRPARGSEGRQSTAVPPTSRKGNAKKCDSA